MTERKVKEAIDINLASRNSAMNRDSVNRAFLSDIENSQRPDIKYQFHP